MRRGAAERQFYHCYVVGLVPVRTDTGLATRTRERTHNTIPDSSSFIVFV